MYRNNNKQSYRRNKYSYERSYSNGNSSKRKFQQKGVVKSFNPYDLVRKASDKFTEEEKYTPTNQFKDFPLEDILKRNIAFKNYVSPTPIQDKIIPSILEGNDVVGIANTGTGKTAAFLIPVINKILKNRDKKVIIIAPTRELAVQIREEFLGFSKDMNIYSVLLIGGVKSFRQKHDLKRPHNVIIGTPGRIKDMMREHMINLSTFDTVVLDEVDHLVDIGFIQDIKFFINNLPKNRQSLFFSATVDGKTKEILASFVKNPVIVSVKKQDTLDNIDQDIIKVISANKKIDQLHDLLIQKNYEKVIIFGRTKWGVQKISDELLRRGFAAGAIHGNKNQNQRQRTLESFKRNEIKILLATDVAARGLDIEDVSHVINYDMPATREDYIHRIGRTGRANRKGTALTFV